MRSGAARSSVPCGRKMPITLRARDGVDGHHGTIKLRWEMLPADAAGRGGGEVVSIGFDFLVLGSDGRIRTGYQFIEA